MIPPLHLLELQFKTLVPIRKLPHFHGCHWSALFRNLLKKYLPAGTSLADAGIGINSVETGINTYYADEKIRLGLSFLPQQREAVAKLLCDFNSLRVRSGHFQPGITIKLEQVYCRISQQPWSPESHHILTPELLSAEIEQLCNTTYFTLRFISPARLTRPKNKKENGHHYCDEDFFLQPPTDNFNPLDTIFKRLRQQATQNAQGLQLHSSSLYWLDNQYGKNSSKTIGGFVGEIEITGAPNRQQATELVIGQYCGIGKNAAFGFGYYLISETTNHCSISPPRRGASLLYRAVELTALQNALKQLPNSSPGPDNLTVKDYRSAGDQGLHTLAQQAQAIKNFSGKSKSYRLPKANGEYRQILVQNAGERIVHRSMGNILSKSIDQLLCSCSYAYRRGLNRKTAARHVSSLLARGYTTAIKADINAFFDSVSTKRLLSLLHGLYPFEPAIELIADWLSYAHQSGISGLPQGGSLSPVLSNLFLDRFDRTMQEANLKMVRYADDFILFLPPDFKIEAGYTTINRALSHIGLQLNPEKTSTLHAGKPIHFLGCLISASTIENVTKQTSEFGDDEHKWDPLFKDDWDIGQPVYLSTLCRGASSNGSHLVIRNDQDEKEKICWNKISRIVAIGRSPISGGVFYRCVRENIPVTFIDIIGKTHGQLLSEHYSSTDLSNLQNIVFNDQERTLQLSREIIAAKIANSQALLRRNDVSRPQLNQLSARAKQAANFDQLRGFEGAAARIYFEAFATIVAPFTFNGRVYHPPDSPVNAMLSFGYTLLYHRIAEVLRNKGFDPRTGFFHQGRGNHCALASDLQEELRHIVERVVLGLIHLKEITPDDFTPYRKKDICSVRLGGDGFRTFIRRFERTMAGKFNYAPLGQISYNGYLDEMAESLRRSLKLNIQYNALRIR